MSGRMAHLLGIFDADLDREGADVSVILESLDVEEPTPGRGRYLPFDDAPTNAILCSIGISPARFKALMSMRRKIEAIEVRTSYDHRQARDHVPIRLFDDGGPGMVELPPEHPCWTDREDNFFLPRELMRMHKGGLYIRLAQNIAWIIEGEDRCIGLADIPEVTACAMKGRNLADVVGMPCLEGHGLVISNVAWESQAEIWIALLEGKPS